MSSGGTKKRRRAKALERLLQKLEKLEGRPVSIHISDACYLMSVDEHSPDRDLFVVTEDARTPWETFRRDLRKDFSHLFEHPEYTGLYWMKSKERSDQPEKFELPRKLQDQVREYLDSSEDLYWEWQAPKRSVELMDRQVLAAVDADADRSSDSNARGEASPDSDDEPTRAMQAIRVRRGQQAFREGLVGRYGAKCLISGCTVMDVVEAAHLRPYRVPRDNELTNGVLLRADIHTLFDLALLGIHPAYLTVHVHPDLLSTEYVEFDRQRLLTPASVQPSRLALRERWDEYLIRSLSRLPGVDY